MMSAFYRWLLPLPLAGLTLTHSTLDQISQLTFMRRHVQHTPPTAQAATDIIWEVLRVMRAR